MNPILRNILAVVAGIAAGSLVNMGIVLISGSLIAPPEGADVTTMEGLKASMHLFEPRHFIFPFLAHALGAFAGGWVAAGLAVSHRLTLALVVGGFFLLGGIANTLMLPSPLWFTVIDLAAYLPAAYLGAKAAGVKKRPVTT